MISYPTQYELFGNVAPYVGQKTSRYAAMAIMPFLGRLENLVLNFIAGSQGRGATCDEVERYLGMPHQTASARIRGLVKKDKIIGSDHTRKTRTGRKAMVWITK